MTISKISDVTVEFLVFWLVELNRLSRDSHLVRGDNHMSLEIVLQKEVSKGNLKRTFLTVVLSYR